MSEEKLLPCPFCGGEPEDGVDEIMKPYLALINSTPDLLSLLYDVDMLPEQTITRAGAVRLAGLCEAWKHVPDVAAGAPSKDVQTSRDCGVDHVEFRTNIINHCANICKSLREKHGSPVGDAYSNGVWDQGVRTEQAIRGLTEALSLSSADRA